MTDITSGAQPEIVEPGTIIGGPEHVYVAVVTNPRVGNQIITAHRTRDGASDHVDELCRTERQPR